MHLLGPSLPRDGEVGDYETIVLSAAEYVAAFDRHPECQYDCQPTDPMEESCELAAAKLLDYRCEAAVHCAVDDRLAPCVAIRSVGSLAT